MSGFYVSNKVIGSDKVNAKCQYLRLRGSYRNECILTKPDVLHAVSMLQHEVQASQPLVLIDGTIYNAGSFDCGSSDESILYSLYDSYGASMLNQLNGSFSFVIYDANRHVLFGARDRLGEKPFFYSIHDDVIECSSSLKSICSGKRYTIDDNAKNMYIRFGWIYDSACIFKEVHKLQAGHYFEYNLVTHEMVITKYWDVTQEFHSNQPVLSREYTVEYLDNLLTDAIRIRMSSEYNMGMGISSGTDSFSIYNYLRCMNYDIPLFSIVPKYTQNHYNEYPEALEHVKTVAPDKNICVKYLDDNETIKGIVDYSSLYDEPNSDFSCIITQLLFGHIRTHNDIRVAYSGIGADDCLFGKPIYGRFFGRVNEYKLTSSALESHCNDSITCCNDFGNMLDDTDMVSMQRYNLKTYLPNLLVKEDIASQYYGIDVRSPFCDYRIVEFASSVSLPILFHGGVYKYLLKQLILNKYNIDFMNNPKRGFAPQIAEIMKIKTINDMVLDTLTFNNMTKYFPEIPFETVGNTSSRSPIKNAQVLLNLYLYISVMEYYKSNVFG